MVKYKQNQIGITFGALADPTRQALLERIAQGEVSVSELAAPTDMSLPAVVKHLRVLEAAGLVVGVKRGRVRWYRLQAQPLGVASDWLAHYRPFWEDQLDALARFLEDSTDDK